MPINQETAQAYVQSTLKKMEASPDALTEPERRLCRKYLKYRSIALQLQQDVQTLRNQIEQAEANIRSKELQVADNTGKASMAMEMMISMKFEEEKEADADFQQAVRDSKKGGSSAPAFPPQAAAPPTLPPEPVNRKQRRAAKAKSKKAKTNQPEQGA